ncbi:DapH/DapD/GlmU-related protein [Vibrio splendidus]
MFYKLLWVLRAILSKPFFGSLGLISYIGKPIYLHNVKNVFIGSRVRIFPGARIETHQEGRIEISDDVSIGQNFHIISAESVLKVGKGTVISANVMVTNVDHEYTNIDLPIYKQNLLYSKTELGENCFVGIGAKIQAGTVLGKHCVVGANSVVRGHFNDYSVIVGSPARVIKKYDLITKEWKLTKN